MKVYFLGTNGWYTTPTGNTPCILIDSKEGYIIFDAGNGIYQIDKYIKENKPIYLFISHFHIDHISGLHSFNKFNFPQGIDVYMAQGRKKDYEAFVNPPYTSPKEIARVSALEKASPAGQTTSSSQASVYIPLGSGGGPWGNPDWYSTVEYQVNLDPGNYPGYKGMYLEVIYKLADQSGTGSVRLYNQTDSSAVSGQVDNTSSSFTLKTSSSFTLPSGSKSYTLQVKSSEARDLYIQSARIRVAF